MTLDELWLSLETSAIGDFVAVSAWAFPTLETLHVIALVTVLGSILVVDLRMLGLASKATPITVLSNDALRLTWIGFVCAATTGLLLFVSKASSYAINPYFQIKIILLALAGLNMLYFHFVTQKGVAQWDSAADIPTAVKVSGAVSLIFWISITFFGRAIGHTLGMFY